jgi:Flp pilus assembly protein TadG
MTLRLLQRPAARLHLRGRPEGCDSERGSVTIQHVFLMPALFTLMFVFVQGAMFYQGRAVALAAAEEGVRVAAAEQGTAYSGIAAANQYIDQTTIGLSSTSVTGTRTAAQAVITVRTHTVSLVPGWRPTITQSATLPVERLT